MLICFDMDGTLVQGNAWQELNALAGVSDEDDRQLLESYTKGSLKYSDWINTLNQYYQHAHLTEESVRDTLVALCELIDHEAADLVNHLHERGYQTVLITGSFDVAAEAVATTLGIKFYRSTTTCQFQNGIFSGVSSEGEERYAKLHQLQTLCTELQIPLSDVVAIGDGGNDLAIFQNVGRSITFTNSPEEIKSVATDIVDSLKDVRTLLL